MEYNYKDVFCYMCGEEVCQTCGCCQNSFCEICSCPAADKESEKSDKNAILLCTNKRE